MAFLRWIAGLLITFGICAFAVMNREDVLFRWNPVNLEETISIPVYIVTLCAMAFGFMFGGMIVWLNAGRSRQDRRQQKKEIKRLEQEINKLKEEKFERKGSPPATDIFPAITAK